MTKRFVADNEYVMQNDEVYVVCKGEHSADVVATALNELIDENEQLKDENNKLKKFIKEDYITTVCETCKHRKDYYYNGPYGKEFDMDCAKGHEDMEKGDCADYELPDEVFK